MRRTATAATAALTLALGLGACDASGSSDPATGATPSANVTTPASVSEHESGPQSPIAYGLEVPRGATQLGPLVRYRSQQLIQAYKPDLEAAEAQKEAEEEKKREEAGEDATPSPSATTPTPDSRPSEDTFDLLEDPPRPDVTVSVMRIDGSPTQIVRRMAAQINAVLPDADLATGDISEYCTSRDQRVTGCSLAARGMTEDERDVRITVRVDPGDIDTRTAAPSDNRRPVMTLKAEYLGDPRQGQLTQPESVDVPRDVEGDDTSNLIWPRMDVDASPEAWRIAGQKIPADGTILLSGRTPSFAAVAAPKVRDADDIAREFAESFGKPTKDVVEDLNEISTTYTAKGKKGTATAIYVLSARGNYAMLFFTPKK